MIKLHPIPDVSHHCPFDDAKLEPIGWYIPGMRNLADLKCPQCGREFYGDLPAGHGLPHALLLEKTTGTVHNRYGTKFFEKWLRVSYSQWVNSPVGFAVEEFRSPRQPILLNCLDALYGHSLLKLLNAQYYLDHQPDFDLILLIPRFLRWMVPDGVAEIWTVDLPLRRGIEWNDWLAAEIKRRIGPLEQCWLSVAFSHPHPEDYDIKRFTQVSPFPVGEWDVRLERPTVTFIWREDRLWYRQYGRLQRLVGRLERKVNLVRRLLVVEQRKRIISLAQKLREALPQLDFAVAGLGHPGGLPDWITDLRTLEINEQIERSWCERYAESHVVIGVHGSNMLLPSAHAGAVVELVPDNRWGNLIQDILPAPQDVREALFRYRLLPLSTSVTIVTEVIVALLRHLPGASLNFKQPWCDHRTIQNDPWMIMRKNLELVQTTPISRLLEEPY